MTVGLAAVLVTVAVVLVLGGRTVLLGRQVRRLSREVEALRQRLAENPLAARSPGIIAPGARRDLADGSRYADADDIIRPVPIGAGDVEPDLSDSRVASVTLAAPLIKVAALSHGVRRALSEENRMRAAYAFRKELRRQRRLRRKRPSAGPPPKEGWRP